MQPMLHEYFTTLPSQVLLLPEGQDLLARRSIARGYS